MNDFKGIIILTAIQNKQEQNNYSLLPESSRSFSGLRFKTELRLDGIGKLGLGRFFNAANACCTASCLTSIYWLYVLL